MTLNPPRRRWQAATTPHPSGLRPRQLDLHRRAGDPVAAHTRHIAATTNPPRALCTRQALADQSQPRRTTGPHRRLTRRARSPL